MDLKVKWTWQAKARENVFTRVTRKLLIISQGTPPIPAPLHSRSVWLYGARAWQAGSHWLGLF